MAQQIHYSVVEAQNKSLGQSGSILIDQDTTDQDATCAIGEGVFGAIQFIEDTVFATLTGETSQLFPSSGQTSTVIDANAGSAATEVTFPAGMTIYGRWTTINLTSGACIAYVG